MSEAQGNFSPRMWIRFKRFSYEAYFDEPDKEKYDDLNLRRYVSLEEAEAMVREAEEKIKKLEWQLSQFKMVGTDGCETCYIGRVDVFQANKRCIQCAPDDYDTYEQRQARAQKEQA